jgi:hypothetical protein
LEQLEERVYSRQEIADILAVDINDNKHFKRNITNKLDKWGYVYNYSTRQVEIIARPQTAEKQLQEIFIRAFGIDIRVDSYAMACFLTMLMTDEAFQSMPWEERAKVLAETYGVNITDRTLKNWYATLLKKNLVASCKYDKTYWITMYINDKKERVYVDETMEDGMNKYFNDRKQFAKEYKEMAKTAGRTDFQKVNGEAWGYAMKKCWEKYHCCYYACGSIYLNAIGDYAQEIYELVEEITAGRKIHKSTPEVREYADELGFYYK